MRVVALLSLAAAAAVRGQDGTTPPPSPSFFDIFVEIYDVQPAWDGTNVRPSVRGIVGGPSSFSHTITSPRDHASGLATGRRMHKPMVLTMEFDGMSAVALAQLAFNDKLLPLVYVGYCDRVNPPPNPPCLFHPDGAPMSFSYRDCRVVGSEFAAMRDGFSNITLAMTCEGDTVVRVRESPTRRTVRGTARAVAPYFVADAPDIDMAMSKHTKSGHVTLLK